MKTRSGLMAQLPVLDLFKESVQLLWQKRKQVVVAFLPALLLLAALDWYSSTQLADQQAKGMLLALVSTLISVLLATTCHHFTLRPEQATPNMLRFYGRNEWRYFLRLIQIGFIAGMVFFAVMMAVILLLTNAVHAQQVVEQPQLAAAGILVAAIPALYLWGRLSITLPELALGQASSLKHAWQLSQGNGNKLALVVVIIPMLSMAPFFALLWLDNTALQFIGSFGTYLTTLISIVALSLSYQFLNDFYLEAHYEISKEI